MTPAPIYLRIEPTRDGLIVHNGDRSVTIERERTRFVVTADPSVYPFNRPLGFGLIEYGRLTRAIVRTLLDGTDKLGGPRALAQWHVDRYCQRIGKEIHREYQRLLEDADPIALSTQRRIFAATFGCPALAFEPELYERPYLLADLERYRALAAVLYDAHGANLRLTERRLQGSRQYRELAAMAAEHDLRIDLRPESGDDPFGATPELTVPAALDLLEQNWRGTLAPTGEPYRSLNRTIENFPGGIPRALVPVLGRIQLEQPITDRLELLAVLAYAERRHELPHLAAFMDSSREQIKRAMQMVGEFTRNDLSPRRSRDVSFLTRFLGDHHGTHNGTATGLARKAIRWHRDRLEHEAAEMLEELGEQPLAPPPIDLPADPRISFIDSTPAIAAEGARMGHCIATYARAAVDGRAFAFHVEQGGPATVLIGDGGQIIDAGGPRNQLTPAMRWGKRKLSAWARDFPAPERRPIPEGELIPF